MPPSAARNAPLRTQRVAGPIVVLTLVMAVQAVNAAVHYQRLASFGLSFPDLMGQTPLAPLIRARDGDLFGTTLHGGTNGSGTVFRLIRNGTGYRTLHHFGGDGDGVEPAAGLVEGSDGMLYGTTQGGGANNAGTIFKLNKDGSGYTVSHSFSGDDGGSPRAELVEGGDGKLYGTTFAGGNFGSGTVFKVERDGNGHDVLHSFNSGVGDGFLPGAGLVYGSDGALYGTTRNGGTNFGGTVFRLNSDGSGYSVLHHFGGIDHDGGASDAKLVEGSDGAIYGTTPFGGTNGGGSVFKLNRDGSAYSVLHSFDCPGCVSGEGYYPLAGLAQEAEGAFYGTTWGGGSNDLGTVFRLNNDGSGYSVLHDFGAGGGDGQSPQAGLVQGSDGAFYGTTSGGGFPIGSGLGTVFKLNKDGTAYNVLRSFNSTGGDGEHPLAGLVEGRDGVLYGTTTGDDFRNFGTVFKLNKDGRGYCVLHRFGYDTGDDGRSPESNLLEGSDGALYGTTHTSSGGFGYGGTVFKLNKDGTGYGILHIFETGGGDGNDPIGGLVEGSDGVLYGTTYVGGTNGNNGGTVFKLSRDGGGYRIVLDFIGAGYEAYNPAAGVIEGSDGSLYGTTFFGGNGPCGPAGCGAIFKVNTDGSGYQILHSFNSSGSDGYNPVAGLVKGSDGMLYGTTLFGGSNGLGTVFKLGTDGSFYRVFYDGVGSVARLVEGRDGALYGTTQGGGSNAVGTVFRLTRNSGDYSVLHSFGSGATDGQNPQAGLMQAADGTLYGTTSEGGDLNFGTVFKLWPPETPDMIGVTIADGAAQVSFAGVTGYQYQVLRSTDLSHWSALRTITMPSSGIYTNSDNTSPTLTVFYRAAWVP